MSETGNSKMKWDGTITFGNIVVVLGFLITISGAIYVMRNDVDTISEQVAEVKADVRGIRENLVTSVENRTKITELERRMVVVERHQFK